MKVGDYVRTKDYPNLRSRIGKITKIDEKYCCLDIDNDTHIVYEKESIIKPSPNIMDLIEKGDYVNGIKVQDVIGCLLVFDGGQDGERYIETEEDIKSIVTKEQFSQIEYKIESEVN